MFRKGDYIRIVETSYDLQLDEKEWILRLTEAAQACLNIPAGLSGIIFDHRFPLSMDPAVVTEALVGMEPATINAARAALSLSPPSVIAFYDTTRCQTFSGMLKHPVLGDADCHAFYNKYIAPADSFSILGLNPDRTGVVFSSFLPKATSFPKPMIEQWERVATHMASGLRLRRALGAMTAAERDALSDGEAILDPSGKLQHAEEPAKAAPMRTALRESVVAVDRARGRMRKGDPAMAVELWRGLVSGRWSLIDRFDSDGRRYYVAYRNDPSVRGIKALSPREKQVLTRLAMGDSNKLIAYELGLSKSVVGAHIASAKKKLGIASRTVLVQMVNRFGLEPPKDA